jgi:hypothetical protein
MRGIEAHDPPDPHFYPARLTGTQSGGSGFNAACGWFWVIPDLPGL